LVAVEKKTYSGKHHVLELTASVTMVDLRAEADGGKWHASAYIGDCVFGGRFCPTRAHFSFGVARQAILFSKSGKYGAYTGTDALLLVVEFLPSSNCWERVELAVVKDAAFKEEQWEQRTV